MPYYVYAIHTDSTVNRRYGAFDDFKEAEACEKEMQLGRYAGDNYIVRMFYAEDESAVYEKIESIRKEQNIEF